MTVKVFSSDYLDDLEVKSAESPRRRQHRNLHADYAEPCQRFFNAVRHDSYLRPHCHNESQGAETLIATRGLMALITFSNDGTVEDTWYFGDAAQEKCMAVGVEVSPGKWHTVVSLDEVSVLFEVKSGPFNPSSPKYLAPWAPEEGSKRGFEYSRTLREIVLRNYESIDSATSGFC